MKLNLKTKIEIAREMYETAYDNMLDIEIQNEYLKTDVAKEINGSDKAEELRDQNKGTVKNIIEKLAFLKILIEKEEKEGQKKK